MKKSLRLSFLCSALLISASTAAQDPDKVTFEKADASHKAAFGQYTEQSVTREESQRAWDSYEQEPKVIDPGSSTSYTTLWEVPGGINNGIFTLSQPYSNFDAIEVWGAKDDGSQGAVTRHRAAQLDHYHAATTAAKAVTLYYSDNEFWTGRFASDKKTFVTNAENCLLYKVVGVNE